MKRKLAVLLSILFGLNLLSQAGGIMTNTNQSASYIRMPILDAVVGPEGGYYNPAGLAFLEDGLHFSVSNQSILQKRTINSNFPGMNRSEFTGTVEAPLFPSAYATFKRDRLALSIGVNPIGGGGSAFFGNGLPSFEQLVAELPLILSASGIPTSQYEFDTEFDAQSIFWGIQANASYAVNDIISVSAGLRYVTASNSYSGYLKGININPNLTNHPQLSALSGMFGGDMVAAPTFFATLSGLLGSQSASLAGVASSLQPIINHQLGGLTMNELLSVPGIDFTQQNVAQLSAALLQLNPTLQPQTLNILNIQAIFNQASQSFAENSEEMQYYQELTGDKEVEVTQKGSSLAPVFGLHLQLSDRVNLAVKYEHRTPLEVTNKTEKDDLGAYPNNVKTANNLPSMLSIGGSFGVSDKLTLNTGIHYYFDKSADYGRSLSNDAIIDDNFIEAGLGFEYKVTRNFLVSAGYLRTQTGVNELYHTDQNHSLSTNTLGTGVRVQFTSILALNAGVLYSHYVPHTKEFSTTSTPSINYKEDYDRSNMVFAIGVDLKL